MVTYLPVSGRLSAQDRRRQLIEVAIDLFSRKGFGGTTTKEIAAAAGVNEAIIFRHFATKRHLYEAILDHKIGDRELKEGFSEVSALMDGNNDEGVFRWLVSEILCMCREDTRFERLMLYAALEGHEIAVMHQNIVNPFIDKLSEYIARRQREGVFIACDATVAMHAVIGGARQYALSQYLFKKTQGPKPQEVVDGLTAILLNGLKIRRKKK